MSFLELIQKAGPAVYPLGLCSILVVAVILDRIFSFTRVGQIPKELMRRVESLLSAGKWQEAIRVLDDSPSAYARIAKSTLLKKAACYQEIADNLTLACDTELANISRALPVLGTIGNIAPFIGLFGTVIGIMHAFMDFNKNGNLQDVSISGGIAEALIATALGLIIGISAVVANNWCLAWVENYRLNLERFSTEWSYRLFEIMQAVEKTPEHVA